MKITKRDLRVFLLGILFTYMISLIWNWDKHVQSFKDGYYDVKKETAK